MPKNPWKQLPIAACPPMLPGCCNIITRRKFLNNLDIGDQPGPGENSLQEIVAQNGVIGYTSIEGGFEYVHVVNSFSAVGTFSEEILIHIGNNKRVRINPARSGEDVLKIRACVTRRQCGSHSRLKHGIALDHTAGSRINLGTDE